MITATCSYCGQGQALHLGGWAGETSDPSVSTCIRLPSDACDSTTAAGATVAPAVAGVEVIHGPRPFAFFAATLNAYEVPLVSPVMGPGLVATR
jgi:hypothetical protein